MKRRLLDRLDRIDGYQREHSWLGFPLGVIYKFFDDQGPYLVALITYYGFLALFPMLLLFVTILGYVIDGDEGLRQDLLDSALGNFPVLGDRLAESTSPLEGSGWGLAIGLAVALYGALGVGQAVQNAVNILWSVPRNERPDPFRSRLQSLVLLAILGIGVLLTTGLGALTGTTAYLVDLGAFGRAGIAIGSVAITAGLSLVAIRVLTAKKVAVKRLLPAAFATALLWQLLQTFGAYYLKTALQGADQVYGVFGFVLGLIGWIYLQGLVLVFVTEVMVVHAQRLWPRALLTPLTDKAPLTRADKKAYSQYAKAATFKGYEKITVDLSKSPLRRVDQRRLDERLVDEQHGDPPGPDRER